MFIFFGYSKLINSLKLSIFIFNVMMILKYVDGFLNQWLVSFVEEFVFFIVFSIFYKFRYCGYRFYFNDLVCYLVLLLLLITLYYNVLRILDVDN